jgi:DNA repair protein SbcD/Mre11
LLLWRRILKIAHFSDLHYSPDRLAEADRCFAFATEDAVQQQARVAVISGDSTDHRLDAHSPALNALARRVHRLAEDMPVLMLQGTFSHEPPGTLSNFALMGESNQVFIADRVQQVALVGDRFFESEGPVFSALELEGVRDMRPAVVFTCLPTVNKGNLAASVGAVAAGTELGDVLASYLAAAGRVNLELRAAGIATVGVSHGTVNGCSTEHGVTMAGFDHEFSIGALFDAQCSAFMLGHIHKHQYWEREGRRVAYPGSIGQFHYGEEGEKGYLMWDVQTDVADSVLVPTPSRQMISIEFDGLPDMERLATLAADTHDKFVRVRWQVDEEHRQLVDRGAIEAMFAVSGGLKLEGRVLPVVRSRAQGISLESTVQGKVERWCELANVEAEPVVERLQLLDSADAEAIAAAVLSRIDLTPETQSLDIAVADGVRDQPVSQEAGAQVTADMPSGPPSLSWLSDDLFAA